MSHMIVPKKLAQALMEASMVPFDMEGGTGRDGAKPPPQGQQTPQAQPVQKMFIGGLVEGVGNLVSGITGAVGNLGFKGPGMAEPTGLMPQTEIGRQRHDEVFKQQQALAQALLAQSQGQGPNPAQNMLNQATAQNVAQQGALMASQRGASSNPALMARLAAQQGAQSQQQAAGQAATLGAQQQLAAQQALAGQQAQMAGQGLEQQKINLGALTGYNNAAAGIQQANTQANAGVLGGILNAGGKALAVGSAAHGAVVPGQAPVPGDHEANDVVPAVLSPGEVVLPRSVVQGPNMEQKVLEFLKHLKKGKGSGGFGDVVKARKMNKGGRC